MIIYTSRLYLLNSPEEALQHVLDWLTYKTRHGRRKLRFGSAREELEEKRYREWNLGGNHKVSLDSDSDGDQVRVHVTYRHPDGRVQGRSWRIEFGISSDAPGETVITILLETEDTTKSASLSPTVRSRPFIVKNLLDSCSVSTRTVGAQVKRIDSVRDARAYGFVVRDSSRDYPFVVVSPDPSGRYLVEIDWLHSHLIGIADVVVVSPKVDIWSLARQLGQIGQYSTSWNGGVAIVYPALRSGSFASQHFVPVERVLPNEFENILNEEDEARDISGARLVLDRLGDQFCKRYTNHHFSVKDLHGFRLKKLLRHSQEISKGDLRAAEQLLEERECDFDSLRKENEHLLAEIQEYREKMSGFSFRSYQNGNRGLVEADRDSISNLVDGACSPEEGLLAIRSLYPERVVVLDSALRSAQSSVRFRNRKKVKELLWNLVLGYWEKRKNDIANPHTVFPESAFSAHESYSGGKLPKRARKLRTFEFGGKMVFMPMHLKIGRGDGPGKGLRIHFAWDDESQRIVIGHCGRHLDLR